MARLPSSDSPGALQMTLRAWYPGCVVREQSDLGRIGPGDRWYALRDGIVRRPFASEDRLFAALGRSRDLIRDSLVAFDRATRIAHKVDDPARADARWREIHERFEPVLRPRAHR